MKEPAEKSTDYNFLEEGNRPTQTSQDINNEYQSLQDLVLTKIQTNVIAGVYPPGAKLGVRELSKQMGVSSAPVREALMRLVADGLVEFKPRIGFFARSITSKGIAEIFRIRQSLENLAISLSVPNFTDEDFLKIEQCLENLEQAKSKDEWMHWNRSLHFLLYGAADSPRLLQMINNLWDAIEAYLRLYISWVGRPVEAQNDHYQLLSAAKESDIKKLQSILTVHFDRTCEKILNKMEEANNQSGKNNS
jgi:DNA-binding GntR family transcriptional regulator